MKKRYLWIALALLAFVAAGVCVFIIWAERQEKEETKDLYEQMRREIRKDPEETENTAFEEKQDKSPLVIPVDFEAAWEINPDIYAWITVPGTSIDYPVVQDAEDDAYYLTRNVEKMQSAAGSIYSEKCNKKDFSDPLTVLYGHNMKDGTMFSDLHKYEDEAFWEDHREIRVYTPDAIRYYRIFAAYLYDDRHLIQSFDCTDKEVYEAYIKEIYSHRSLSRVIDEDVQVTTDDRLLTLSTCHSMGNIYRYLVQAVLVREEK